jgi:cobalt/nickel transport system permease protein
MKVQYLNPGFISLFYCIERVVLVHIPDGYLSLQTSIPVFGAMLPIWSAAVKRVKKSLNLRQIPLLALCAAFSFVVMMFNIPLGPSSVHAVGAVFIAVLLGPWAACIAISVALAIQAVVFGDGGILSLGANSFNIAFVMPFAGYYIYRLIAGNSNILSKRSLAAVFIGSYAGINAAALLTAVELGIQPLLFKSAGGIPEYGFYPLSVSVPVMMFEHLLVAGPVEGIVTVSAVAYAAKFSPHLFDRSLIQEDGAGSIQTGLFARYKALIVAIAVLVVLTPLGLMATGTAWGEWGMDEVKGMLGYVPAGLESMSGFWKALMPGYTVHSLNGGFFKSSLGYVISAVIGILIIVAVMLLSSKLTSKRDD